MFDLGNTLVGHWGGQEDVFQKILNSVGIQKSAESVKKALAETEKEFKDNSFRSLYGKMPCDEYWNEWDSCVLKHLNLPKNDKLAKYIQAEWFNYLDLKAYPDAIETLSKLKQKGLKTGLITTAYEEEITVILGKAKIQKKLFDVIVGADTIEKVKPHPDVFAYALSKLEVKPEETLFIGDSIDADYEGAENAGLTAVLVQRTQTNVRKNKHLNIIKNLEEIFKYIN
jgi:HAD superfamily hydrolase (TIGR01549 family)